MILLAAGDDGPRQTVHMLEGAIGAVLPETRGGDATADAYWRELIRSRLARGVVCGTSDSAGGKAVESAARRAAAATGIPAAAIEDFPGNYYVVQDGAVALLVVESDAVAQFTHSRLGAACPPMEVLSPARYDTHRSEARTLRERTVATWASSGDRTAVLWAGQPETADCLRTLEAVLPLIAAQDLLLLFKAHPRDPAYHDGAYRSLLARHAVPNRDVTGLTVPQALALGPRLVITQFSSVAVEAGFWGIPSLSILLDNAGGARLRAKKGYSIPPYCEAGAAAVVISADALPDAFSRALGGHAQRENIICCFDEYFRTGDALLPPLAELLTARFQW